MTPLTSQHFAFYASSTDKNTKHVHLYSLPYVAEIWQQNERQVLRAQGPSPRLITSFVLLCIELLDVVRSV